MASLYSFVVSHSVAANDFNKRKNELSVHVNEEQAHAILNIKARSKNIKDPVEIEPLLAPDNNIDGTNNITPTY